jgi:hypothetical protein
VSPKSHGMSCPIVRAAVIWKVDHGSGRSGCSAARRPFRCLSRRTSGGRRSARIRQKHGRSVETKTSRLRLSRMMIWQQACNPVQCWSRQIVSW